MIDRLTTDARIDAMVTGIREVAALTDPVAKRSGSARAPTDLSSKSAVCPSASS